MGHEIATICEELFRAVQMVVQIRWCKVKDYNIFGICQEINLPHPSQLLSRNPALK